MLYANSEVLIRNCLDFGDLNLNFWVITVLE